jgi:Abortive infection C-terminus
MKISEYTLKHLSKAVCGDSGFTPYVNVQNLILYFSKYGLNADYENGFPSRWKFTEDKMRELNGKDALREVIQETVDPRRFHGLQINVDDSAMQINEIIKYDNLELRKIGEFYKLVDLNGSLILPLTSNEINHSFINEQIDKCHSKIIQEDYNGAITNARSLIEAIFIEIIERSEGKEIKNDGDVENLWKKVKKIMKLEIEKDTMPDFVVQILSGIETSIKGLAGLSNNAGDRHANKFNTRKHHAKLAVNLSMTISDFLIDSWKYQLEKVKS